MCLATDTYGTVILPGVSPTHPEPHNAMHHSIGAFLVADLERCEKDVALLVAIRNELGHEQEEGGEGVGLEDLEPGLQVDMRCRVSDAQKREERVRRYQQANA